MGTRAQRKRQQQLEDQFYNLEKRTACANELNEDNVEETTLNYANSVKRSERLAEKALIEKSVKCFNIDARVCKNVAGKVSFQVTHCRAGFRLPSNRNQAKFLNFLFFIHQLSAKRLHNSCVLRARSLTRNCLPRN